MSQSYPWLKLPHREYLISVTYASLKPIERLAFLELVMIAHTQPKKSLPDNDKALAGWSGMSIKQWLKVKDSVFCEWLLVDGFWFLPDWFNIESPQDDNTNHQQDNVTPRQQRNAERQKRYRERNAKRNTVTPESVTRNDSNVTQDVTRNATVTPSNVTHRNEMGGKGGDLDLNKDLDLDLKQELNSHSKTREAEKNSRGFFDDELRPDLNLLNAKLGANLVTQKFIDENLFLFNSHYETHQLTDNQRLAKWIAWWKGEQAKQQAQTIQRPSKAQSLKNTKPVFGNVNDSFPINPNDRLLTQEEKEAIAKSLEEDEHVVF